jgi:hypothetical protein
LLGEILKGSNTTDGQNQDHKFSIAAPTRSANVVLGPSEQGNMTLLLVVIKRLLNVYSFDFNLRV